MLTRAEGRKQRAAIMREIAREHRRAQRDQLRGLREAIRDARASRRLAIKDARHRCKVGRLEARARARELRTRLLAEMRAAVAAERKQARDSCATAIEGAKAIADRVQRSRAELAAERSYRAELKQIEKSNRARAKELRASTGPRRGESRSQSDDEVRGNIPPELVGLWERVKSKIKGSGYKSRTEAFLHYAEEHPTEVLEVLEDKTEELIRELQAQERDASRALRRPLPRAVYDEVPF